MWWFWQGVVLISQTIAYAFKELLIGLETDSRVKVRFWSELVLAKQNLFLILRVNAV